MKANHSRVIRLTAMLIAGVLAANVLAWEFELRGWRRDLTRGVPFVAVICWTLLRRARSAQCEPRHGQRRKYRR